MATKKKPAKKKAPKQTTSEKNAIADNATGTALANQYYAPGSLGRITAPPPVNTLTLPGQITPISTEMAGGAQSIAQAEDAYSQSREKDQYVEAALQKGLDSLGGFNSAEGQALKAQALRGVNSDAATNARTLASSAGQNGVSGGALQRLVAQQSRDKSRLVAQANTDLAVGGLQEQGRRLDSFASQAQSAYGQRAGVQNQALQTLLGARSTAANYTLNAETANQTAQGADIANQVGVEKANADITGSNNTNALSVSEFNQGEQDKEKAGYLGTLFGSIGVSQAQRAADQQNDLAKKYLQYATKKAG